MLTTLAKKTITAAAIGSIAFVSIASGEQSWESLSANYNKAGAIAAGFADVAKGDISEDVVREKFKDFDSSILDTAVKWSQDPELEGSAPAFRRFLIFEYLTETTDFLATATNPQHLLINVDSSLDNVFADYPEVIDWGYQQMEQKIETPAHTTFDGVEVSVYPMIPPEAKADSCIACHASAEVNRPYDEGAKVLGYTFVAKPK